MNFLKKIGDFITGKDKAPRDRRGDEDGQFQEPAQKYQRTKRREPLLRDSGGPSVPSLLSSSRQSKHGLAASALS